MKDSGTLLEVSGLSVSFPNMNRKKPSVNVVSNVSFIIKRGETLGLVGESGCGKTTLGRTIIRLQKEDSGSIILNGCNLCTLHQSKLRTVRRQMQMIFQNPYSSLNPRMTVLDIISEPLLKELPLNQRISRVAELMVQSGLDPQMIEKFPHEFSGGQRQRIAIARAIAANPLLIIADEPVSSLDVSVQAQILNILKSLSKTLSLTMIFISHDLSVVRYISQKTAVMYSGAIMEMGSTESLFRNPRHPYTRALLNAVPQMSPNRKIYTQGTVLNSDLDHSDITGCPFFARCPYAAEDCRTQTPHLQETGTSAEHLSACIREKELGDFRQD